eukprot:TRINITY_DN1372_c0_g1_i1.p1 TRINITY_DN1372_c0_g1~~TRINITY_DN1372_c0_g1_i1.p1  ORF type:complete len:597 (+),score=148.22 TRINITY_DN1372_c0_g1_i1:219-2009(+)
MADTRVHRVGKEIFPVIKINRQGYPQKRTIVIDHSKNILAYGESADIESTAYRLDLDTLIEVRRGKDTEILQTSVVGKWYSASKCLSLKFASKTLHLVCESPAHRDLLYRALKPALVSISASQTLDEAALDFERADGNSSGDQLLEAKEDLRDMPAFQTLKAFGIKSEDEVRKASNPPIQKRNRLESQESASNLRVFSKSVALPSSSSSAAASATQSATAAPFHTQSLDPFELVERTTTLSKTTEVPEFAAMAQFSKVSDTTHLGMLPQAVPHVVAVMPDRGSPFDLVTGTSTLHTETLTVDSMKMPHHEVPVNPDSGIAAAAAAAAAAAHHQAHHKHKPALGDISFDPLSPDSLATEASFGNMYFHEEKAVPLRASADHLANSRIFGKTVDMAETPSAGAHPLHHGLQHERKKSNGSSSQESKEAGGRNKRSKSLIKSLFSSSDGATSAVSDIEEVRRLAMKQVGQQHKKNPQQQSQLTKSGSGRNLHSSDDLIGTGITTAAGAAAPSGGAGGGKKLMRSKSSNRVANNHAGPSLVLETQSVPRFEVLLPSVKPAISSSAEAGRSRAHTTNNSADVLARSFEVRKLKPQFTHSEA